MNNLETSIVTAARKLFSAHAEDRSAKVATLRAAVQAYEDFLIAEQVGGITQEERFYWALRVSGRTVRIKNALQAEGLSPADLAGMHFSEISDIRNLGALSMPAIIAALHFAGYETVANYTRSGNPPCVEYDRLLKLMRLEGGEGGN